ncbi:12785_t:CDS:1 [Funneliformis mosseae]|uniref:12785_t:CDS:1 n=1 Tax=Funneliformis mosseae TaxID=27381 RepID=A0A9N9GJ49_FUNMO|nr:12785_t:CDS:1 [Funneliformis mosseae]
MEETSIKTNSTILQNDLKETTAILRFEVPLKKGQGNNVIYFPDLINPPKAEITMNNQNFFTSDNSSLEQNLDEMDLENFVVSETADFLEHMAVEKRPEPKFYAISRKSTTPGFFGAGTNINPPENILQFFNNEISNDKSSTITSNTETIENNENKNLNKPTKSRTRKNATTSKSKGKKAIKQEEKLTSSVSEAVGSMSKKTKRQPSSQQSETKAKKQKTKVNEGNKTIIKSESKYLEIQRLLEKHKRRKEKKINKDASTSGIVSSSSSKNSTPIAKSLKSLIHVEDDSSLSLSSTSSTESSPKRKGRIEVRSRGSSSTSSTVTSTKASKVNTKSKSKTSNPNNYNAESPGLTPMTISSESTPTP